MPRLLAIDPGPALSAYVVYSPPMPLVFGKIPNRELLTLIRDLKTDPTISTLVYEQIAAMGMAVGEEVFETCVWSGRFVEAWEGTRPGLWGANWFPVKRHAVKMHLCGSMRAKDANIRQAVIDKFGGKAATKKGGALYKLSGDCWSALAVALTFTEAPVVLRPENSVSPLESHA